MPIANEAEIDVDHHRVIPLIKHCDCSSDFEQSAIDTVVQPAKLVYTGGEDVDSKYQLALAGKKHNFNEMLRKTKVLNDQRNVLLNQIQDDIGKKVYTNHFDDVENRKRAPSILMS
jgi:hypothetical protein